MRRGSTSTEAPRDEELGRALAAVHDRIGVAAARAGRSADEVALVAVTKTHPAQLVAAAIAAGVSDIGENRLQEAAAKHAELGDAARAQRWHMLGPVQRNKARRVAELFDMVHSVGSVSTARALDRAAEGAGRGSLDILLQVNVSAEHTKSGFSVVDGPRDRAGACDFVAAAEEIAQLQHVRPRGLMTMAPFAEDPELARPIFRALAELRDLLRLDVRSAEWRELSMGMSGDFEVAVEEGATLVRLGRVVFGDRH